ncbi:TPA: hypothetical protein ACP5VL_004574 [Vibrio parahaemolyticus]|uniref:hypothetical protein n=1 Tax=Vibrio parahaemolyticus TaxID=670 RepID=UPI001EFCDA19|nr:hypothetical protein [Vibrio parahaemolyticus]MCG9541522.1 hypothetical protein [Vibrio parahaemolyticus]
MNIKKVQQDIEILKHKAESFFSSAKKICGNKNDKHGWPIRTSGLNHYWDELPDNLQINSLEAQKLTLGSISLILPLLKASPILNISDEKDIGLCAKRMRAALKLRKYKSWEIEVLHDEGAVLGVSPPGQSEDEPEHPEDASKTFFTCLEQLEGMVQLIEVAPNQISDGLMSKNPNLHQSYRPNTAFIMMPIDPNNPELEDVYEVYKDCFSKFGIKAIRADDIEHEDVITKKIIEEIKTSEFLLGDLTNERPSVYYEIGYAHSLGRRVILYRKKNTSIHFDLAAYNCPEYKSMSELKKLLLKRLEDTTNRKPNNS